MGRSKSDPPSIPREGPAAGTVKILLVDDEVGYLRVLANRLRKRKFDVSEASGGAEGLRALRQKTFDVAVLDLKMEDMDGIEVLKIFKKMDPNMQVIMLTGHGSEEAARQGIALGAFSYLTKPCELDELLEKIKQATGSRTAT